MVVHGYPHCAAEIRGLVREKGPYMVVAEAQGFAREWDAGPSH